MRAELLLDGVNPGKLLSPRDITLRGVLVKRKASESHRLRAIMASSLGDSDAANESYSDFVDSIWYSKIKGNRNDRMSEEYHTLYRNMTPEISIGADGKPTVRGLN